MSLGIAQKRAWVVLIVMQLLLLWACISLKPIYAAGIILGIAMSIINSLAQTFIQTIVPKDKWGRITSIDWFLSNLISPIGAIISGPLALILGIPGLLMYSAIIGLIIPVSLWCFTKIRKLDYDDEAKLKKIIEDVNNI